MRRQQLSEAQITALLDPPTDQRELGRHYTLFAADLAAIRRCRGDCNRLGHALMLCYLRYPGRPLRRASGRRGRFACSSQSRLTLFRSRSRTISPRSGTDGAMRPSCKTASSFGPLGRVLPPIWPAGCCRTRSRPTGLRISPGWWWRSAGGAASSSHRPARLSDSASKPAIGRAARSNAG